MEMKEGRKRLGQKTKLEVERRSGIGKKYG